MFKTKYIVFFLLIYFTVMVMRGWLNNRTILKRCETLQKNFAQEQLTHKLLLQKKAQLQNKDYLEMLARQKLGLVKPGEIVYKIYN